MAIIEPVINLPVTSQTLPADWPGNFWGHWVLFTLLIIIGFFLVFMGYIYIARRGIGRMGSRVGPNRTGPFGLVQALADAVKVITKESITPDAVDKPIYWLAPIVSLVPVFLVFAVIPFTNGGVLADLNIGILFIVAISSISTLGMFMAGWSSNNKFSLISSMRVVAAVISYEFPMIIALASVLLMTGSLSLNDMVLAQDIPFILLQPLGFVIFFLAGLAEVSRAPFDLIEADQEIVAGFFVEYSGVKFVCFYLMEFGESILFSALITTIFLGGWRGPILPEWIWFLVKCFIVWSFIVWIWGTLPRVRIDQMMAIAWKFLLPLSVINLIITAIEILVLPEDSLWIMIPVNFAVTIVLILFWSKKFFVLGRGRVEV
ncbi:MAG: NADH-quinone oxidoreductase subunit NuoH [Dehalococcoidales bacterium]|nr:MAG: NADH-quinone oxidoreductase subunit NuoH [Dehalococcoidales bacterium]